MRRLRFSFLILCGHREIRQNLRHLAIQRSKLVAVARHIVGNHFRIGIIYSINHFLGIYISAVFPRLGNPIPRKQARTVPFIGKSYRLRRQRNIYANQYGIGRNSPFSKRVACDHTINIQTGNNPIIHKLKCSPFCRGFKRLDQSLSTFHIDGCQLGQISAHKILCRGCKPDGNRQCALCSGDKREILYFSRNMNRHGLSHLNIIDSQISLIGIAYRMESDVICTIGIRHDRESLGLGRRSRIGISALFHNDGIHRLDRGSRSHLDFHLFLGTSAQHIRIERKFIHIAFLQFQRRCDQPIVRIILHVIGIPNRTIRISPRFIIVIHIDHSE